MSLAEFSNKYRSLARYVPEVASNDEVKDRRFIRALKPEISKQLAGFQVKTFQEALSRGFSIEREEENRITEQEIRLKRVPKQLPVRQDPAKRLMTSMPGQTFFRPSEQPWKMGSASRPPSSSYTQPSVTRPDTLRTQGQTFRPQGRFVRLQQVRPTGSINLGHPTCFYCKESGYMKKDCPVLQGGTSSSQQGMVYSVTQEGTPTETVSQEGEMMYAVL
ncbi:uncharacterized protein LOC113290109 [Papaver somniferum]|uniref:uncharacterized protein LOC113290109 n=1 Tax=Papaver somniferum TaxID=3469 RepID=UPI000E70017B|nr:uncharacterized protein LOC113290109 [Papaver somniferum]